MPDLPEPRLFFLRLMADRRRLHGSVRDLEHEQTRRFEAGDELLQLLQQALPAHPDDEEDPQ